MLLFATALPCFSGGDALKGRFDLPADRAETSLKLLSEQSGVEVLFPTDVVAGVRTNAVQGEMTARQALDAMLVGTALVAVEGKSTVSLTVKRRTPGEDAREKTRSADQSSAGKPSRELPEEDETSITKQPMKKNKILSKLGALLVLIIAPMDAQTATTPPGAAEPAPPDEAVIKLSPFEVTANDRGYYGSNTISGSRLNSSVEDLAAPLTVVTKDQMIDFAMLDINDIFLYQAGVEGTGTYTDAGFDRNGTPLDNSQLEPTTANRVRGIGPANVAFNNYQVSGRIPLDPILSDSIEISRGPNANIFGLGGASGTVNTVPVSANLQRDQSQVGLRADSFGGWRASLDVNRVIKKDALGVRFSAVRERKGFDLKPSGVNNTLLNGLVTYKPFKNTKLTAAYSHYQTEGTSTNRSLPRDFVSLWLASGKPTWNAKTGMINYADGRPSVAATVSTLSANSGGALTQWSGANTVYVNPDGSIGYWSISRGTTSTTDPVGATLQTTSFLATVDTRPLRTGLGTLFVAQPLFGSEPPVRSKDVYDWSSINLGSNNFLRETGTMLNIELEQVFFSTPRQLLAAQVGYFKETGKKFRREFIGNNSDSFSGNFYVDANEVLLDGTPNPYLGRTFIGARFPTSYDSPLSRENGRLQLAYKLDLTQEKNILRWLGLHQLLGYAEYKDILERKLTYRDTILSDHAWLAHGVARAPTSNLGGLPKGPNSTLNWFNYYVGDNQGTDIDHAPRDFTPGTYNYHWGNGVTSAFFTEPAQLGLGANGSTNTAPNNTANSRNILRTQGGVLQSHFLNNRIVSTVGLRRDWSYNKFGGKSLYLPGDGLHVDMNTFNSWEADWQEYAPGVRYSTGMTKTYGVVARPLPGKWSNLLGLHYNRSDSFKPSPVKSDMHLNILPDPMGESIDYGFTLNLLDGKLTARYIQYDTKELNSRRAQAVIATRLRQFDFTTQGYVFTADDPYNLIERATRWVTDGWIWNATAKTWTLGAPNPALTADQINEQVSIITGLSLAHIATTTKSWNDFSSAGDVQAKGREVEINYNPSRFWRMQLNVSKQESLDLHVAKDLSDWITERMAYWTTIVDPELLGTSEPNNPNHLFWEHSGYTNNPTTGAPNPPYVTTPHQQFDGFVKGTLAVDQALEGKSKPSVRKYSARMTTSFDLAGVTDHRIWKRFTVIGSLRWEDKGAIGFLGLKGDPTKPTVYTSLDATQPIWDKGHTYLDLGLRYHTRLFSDRVSASFQLNVKNVQESGRLQGTAAFPDGTISNYRIIDPRQFILSATFNL